MVSSRFQKQKQENDLFFFKKKKSKIFFVQPKYIQSIFKRFVFLQSGKTITLKHQIPHTKLDWFLIRENTKTSNPYKKPNHPHQKPKTKFNIPRQKPKDFFFFSTLHESKEMGILRRYNEREA